MLMDVIEYFYIKKTSEHIKFAFCKLTTAYLTVEFGKNTVKSNYEINGIKSKILKLKAN